MPDKNLTSALQESVLTLICMNDEKGGYAANIVDVDLFDRPYDDIVRRAVDYHHRFKCAPGEAHIDDLFDHVLSDSKNKNNRLYQQVLGSILEQAKGLNVDYTVSRLNDFMRRQTVRSAILQAAERFERGGEDDLADAEGILHTALKFAPEAVDAGTFLSDKSTIQYLTKQISADWNFGIDELDKRGIGLSRGEAFGFMAAKGRGKTWKCVHVGVKCIMQNAKVLHVSLEMKDERIFPRYQRRLFAIAKKREKYKQTVLELDELNRVIGFKSKLTAARMSLRDRDIERRVATKMDDLGRVLDRLVVKVFPTSTLTLGQLTAYLDSLYMTHGFTPDVLILDYPKLMHLDRRQDLRIGLGLMMEQLRGLCMERNMAGFFPMQSNREGEEAALLTGKHTGEDYSLTQTVDNLITYNQTAAEKQLHLARLFVDKARSDEDGFTVLISQDYETGQFVKQSAFMPNDYFRMVKDEGGGDD